MFQLVDIVCGHYHHTFGCTYAGGVSCPENFVLIGSYIGGTVLSGTKYGLKQTRGKFGLGAKMVSVLLCVYIWQQLFLYVNVSKISNLYLWGVMMTSHCHS